MIVASRPGGDAVPSISTPEAMRQASAMTDPSSVPAARQSAARRPSTRRRRSWSALLWVAPAFGLTAFSCCSRCSSRCSTRSTTGTASARRPGSDWTTGIDLHPAGTAAIRRFTRSCSSLLHVLPVGLGLIAATSDPRTASRARSTPPPASYCSSRRCPRWWPPGSRGLDVLLGRRGQPDPAARLASVSQPGLARRLHLRAARSRRHRGLGHAGLLHGAAARRHRQDRPVPVRSGPARRRRPFREFLASPSPACDKSSSCAPRSR